MLTTLFVAALSLVLSLGTVTLRHTAAGAPPPPTAFDGSGDTISGGGPPGHP